MNLAKIVGNFHKANILIIGDIIFDRYIRGDVKRISPEAPVPVVEVKSETTCLGGMGNVAANITSLKGNVFLCTVVGNDSTAESVFAELKRKKIRADGVFVDEGRITPVKTRIIGDHQQIVRVDRENAGDVSHRITQKIVDFIKLNIKKVDAVLISDYGKGVITKEIVKKVISVAKSNHKIVTVDPKIEHFTQYKRVDCITPNTLEAMAGMNVRKISSEVELADLGKKILKKLGCRSVLITRGKDGMMLLEKNSITQIPTAAREVYDVTGAGDTVISVLTLALACKATLIDAAKIANFAAGIVVGKLGTAVVTPEELVKAVK